MNKCLKCDVLVDSLADKCPLCNSQMEKSKDSSYPNIKRKLTSALFRKIMFLIAITICMVVALVNYILTPNIKWSYFVILQIILMCYVFYHLLNGRGKVVKLLFVLNILVCGLSIFWDNYTGFRGWSINYVFPSLCITYGIFMIILRFVSYFAFRENSSYIYLNVCLEFLPVLLLNLDKLSVGILAYISAGLGMLNLLILIAFDGSSLKSDIARKLHI